MTDLLRLQQAFGAYLMKRPSPIGEQIVSDEKASASERMDLYAGAYRSRLIEVLGNDFPVLWSMLGDEQFWKLCLHYIEEFPSTYPSVRDFGSSMELFLRSRPPYRDFPQVAEIAMFEWAQNTVFDAPDQRLLSADQLTEIPADEWPALRFEFASAMQLLDMEWNTVEVWSALNKASEPPEQQPLMAPETWLLWRQNLNVHWRRLDVDEAWALRHALAGDDFASLCEGLLEWIDPQHVSLRAAQFLKSWINCHIVVGLCH